MIGEGPSGPTPPLIPQSTTCPTCGTFNVLLWQEGQVNYRCSKCASVIAVRTTRGSRLVS